MIPEWVTLGGGAIGALVAAKWLWRGAAIASALKVLAGVLVALAVLSVAGIVSVSIDGGRLVGLVRLVWDLVSGPLGALMASGPTLGVSP